MQRFQRAICQLHKTSTFVNPNAASATRYFSTEKADGSNDEILENTETVESKKVELSGFAKAFEKFAAPEPEKPEEIKSFAHLVRHSKFIDLGDPEGKVVTGRIYHVVGDDLYIDFGWKFNCVCQRPARNGSNFVRGAAVRLMIKDLELSTKFLGAKKDLTILEADCTLLGLINSPIRNVATTMTT